MPHIDPCRPHLVLADSLKAVREALCVAQTALNEPGLFLNNDSHSNLIGRLIAEIDRQRPLGPDGTHGDRHTDTCGCESPGMHCTHWHARAACCRCGEPPRPAPERPHAPEIAEPDGLGYGLCIVCRELWPCTTWRGKTE